MYAYLVSVISCHQHTTIEESHGIFGLDEGIVDCNDLDIVVLHGISEDKSSDSA